jgi:HEAT repeat protein
MKRTIIAWTGVLLFGLASSAQAGVEDKEIAQHIKDLSVEDSAVRTQAIRYLGNLGAAGLPAVPDLVRVLTEAKEPALRNRAGRALAQIGGASVTPLIELLKHEDMLVRRQAAAALARIGPDARAAQPALVTALKDSSASVRALAASALGEINTDVPATARALAAMLTEGEPVRGQVSAALVRLGRPAVPALCDALRDKQANERYHSARILALLGPEAAPAVPHLIDALRDKEPPRAPHGDRGPE